jgi:hypothetical protein
MKKILSTYSLTIALLLSFLTPHILISSPVQPFFIQKLEQGREKAKSVAYTLYERWQNLMNKSKSGVRRRVDGVKGSLEAQVALVGLIGLSIAYALEARAHKRLKQISAFEDIMAESRAGYVISDARKKAESIKGDAQGKVHVFYQQLLSKAEELRAKEAELAASSQEIEALRLAPNEIELLEAEQKALRIEVAVQASRLKDILDSMQQAPAKAGRSPRSLNPFSSPSKKRNSKEQQEEFLLTARDIQDNLQTLSQEATSAREETTVWNAVKGSVRRAFSFGGDQGRGKRPKPKIPTFEQTQADLQPPLHGEWKDFYSVPPSHGGLDG